MHQLCQHCIEIEDCKWVLALMKIIFGFLAFILASFMHFSRIFEGQLVGPNWLIFVEKISGQVRYGVGVRTLCPPLNVPVRVWSQVWLMSGRSRWTCRWVWRDSEL